MNCYNFHVHKVIIITLRYLSVLLKVLLRLRRELALEFDKGVKTRTIQIM